MEQFHLNTGLGEVQNFPATLDGSLGKSSAPSQRAAAGFALRGWAAWKVGVISAGVLSSVLFVLVGLTGELQLYADGSIFAYSIAVQDSWAIHWHNIVGRVAVYLATVLPSEVYVALTGNARGGIVLYGLLFFSAQLVGLIATYAADRSAGRVLFTSACLSTASLCPLVFGFPTEMWFSHALFWPTLAFAHYAPPTLSGFAILLAGTAALIHTHGGGVIFAAVVAFTCALRSPASHLYRILGALSVAMVVWVSMQAAVRPDGQISPILMWAAFNFIDPRNFFDPVIGLLVVATVGYAGLFSLIRRWGVNRPALVAWGVTAGLLAIYWATLDDALLSEDRYFLRTALFYITPAIGLVSTLSVLQQECRLIPALAWLPDAGQLMRNRAAPAVLTGALALVLLVHVVETGKFVSGWRDYMNALRTLASVEGPGTETAGTRFVSSHRVQASLNGYSWSSTTHYLSIVAQPALNPARLVIDPDEGYHWITCTLAKRHVGRHTVPERARMLVEKHACSLPRD